MRVPHRHLERRVPEQLLHHVATSGTRGSVASMRLAPALVSALAIGAGCGPSVANDPAPVGSGSTMETTHADDGTSMTGAAEDDFTGGLSVRELEQLCAMQVDRESCDAIPPFDLRGDFYGCTWHAWVPVSQTENGCSYGEPTASCVMERTSSIGCASPNGCELYHVGFRRMGNGGLEVARVWDGCFPPGEPCSFFADASPEPPECGCACERGFPG